MSKASILIAAVAMVVCTTAATAADPFHDVTIDIHQCEGKAWFIERDGTTVHEKQKLSHAVHFDVRPDERVTVRVFDQNPFVYSYKWQPGTATETPDFAAAKKFADAVTPVVELLKAFQAQSAAFDREAKLKEVGITSEFITEYKTDLDALIKAAKLIDGLKAKAVTCDPVDRKDVKDTVKKWDFPALKKRLAAKLQTIDNASVALLTADLPVHTPILVASLDSDFLAELLQQDKGSVIGDPVKTPPAPQPNVVAPSPVGPLEQQFILIRNTQTYATQLLNTVGEFVKKVDALDTPLDLGTVDYSTAQDQPATLSILKEGQDKPTDVAFVFHPYSAVALSVDAAALYSFVEARHYTAKPDGTTFKIARTDSGDSVVGTTVGAMLSITPRNLVKSPVGVAFQLGVSPVQDKIGIFTGVGIRFFDLITVGGGLALQQSQRLGDGLVEGQSINAAADLKTDNQFKAAGYWTVSVKIVGTKK